MALRTRFSRAIMVSAWLITASACASGMQITPSVSASSRSPGLTVTAPMRTGTCSAFGNHAQHTLTAERFGRKLAHVRDHRVVGLYHGDVARLGTREKTGPGHQRL